MPPRACSQSSPAVGEDLIHLLQGAAYTELRPAIDAAIQDQSFVEVEEFALEEPESGEPRYLKMVVHPQDTGSGGDGSAAESVMIVIDDITVLCRERDDLRQRLQHDSAELERVSYLNKRLSEKNRWLERGNRELTRANEELRVINEEYSFSTEEAQAATEESETLNEELQATNEELNTTNYDQQARGLELVSRSRESDRRQTWLASILEGLDRALIVVDTEGNSLLRTTAHQRMFGEGVPEFLQADGTQLPADASPGLRAARGEWFVEQYAVAAGSGYHWYEVSGWPIDEDDARAGGAVIIQERGKTDTLD